MLLFQLEVYFLSLSCVVGYISWVMTKYSITLDHHQICQTMSKMFSRGSFSSHSSIIEDLVGICGSPLLLIRSNPSDMDASALVQNSWFLWPLYLLLNFSLTLMFLFKRTGLNIIEFCPEFSSVLGLRHDSLQVVEGKRTPEKAKLVFWVVVFKLSPQGILHILVCWPSSTQLNQMTVH